MAFCTECGHKIEGFEKFCTECGTPVISGKVLESKDQGKAIKVKPSVEKSEAKASLKKCTVNDFTNVKFKWSFRDYQQKVLDNAQKHLKDKRIHIVAAPGSGKTILGLELVRRLGRPALVMSPSVTIRGQWGERFAESYLPDSESADDYISYNLAKPKLITSITYQALHAAFTKTKIKAEDDNEALESEEDLDFSNFELLDEIKKAGITTLCLDEAHHLKSEWQKALEKFIELLGDSVDVISLTATPPYDSTPGEWNRYISLCGEIDEEIFVPQLVLQKTLCPHQDYVYFSYPDSEEMAQLDAYKEKAKSCTETVISSGLVYEALKYCGVFNKETLLYDHIEDFAALTLTAEQGKATLSSSFKDKVYEGRKKRYSLSTAEKAFNFIISNPDIFGAISEKLNTVLSENGLVEKKKVCLSSTDKLNKMLVSSAGKLKSIRNIALEEYQNLGEDLRMLILTDYIKKDMLPLVGTDEDIHAIGTVPVFEILRRNCPDTVKIALLSGTLVILPASAVEAASELAKNEKVDCKVKPIPNTQHCEVYFGASNKNKVSIITRLFGDGYINILIGTKSLLGEGWDSPNINSLILASFVGSFMLSNQMRGRAIRIDKKNPDKISNIWHPVTVDPTSDNTEEIGGEDYATLKRRFACFQAPAYNSDSIESGVDRLDVIKPPFTPEGIDSINEKTLALARDRKSVVSRWNNTVKSGARPEVLEVSEVPAEVHPVKALYKNKLHAIILAIGIAVALLLVIIGGFFGKIIGLAIGVVLAVLLIGKLSFISGNASPEKSIASLAGAVHATLRDLGEVDSGRVKVSKNEKTGSITCFLEGASAREKSVFANAVSEMLSPIVDPRYILVYKGRFGHDWIRSYACPSVIGKNKENASVLTKKLKGKSGNFDLVFTRNAEGRKALFHCRRYSYINLNAKFVKNKKVVK